MAHVHGMESAHREARNRTMLLARVNKILTLHLGHELREMFFPIPRHLIGLLLLAREFLPMVLPILYRKRLTIGRQVGSGHQGSAFLQWDTAQEIIGHHNNHLRNHILSMERIHPMEEPAGGAPVVFRTEHPMLEIEHGEPPARAIVSTLGIVMREINNTRHFEDGVANKSPHFRGSKSGDANVCKHQQNS